MTESSTQIRDSLARFHAGDRAARDRLVEHFHARLQALAHCLRTRDRMARWIETGDIVNEGMIRLLRALESERPETPERFYGLAARHMRLTLIDLARKEFGRRGYGANHATECRPVAGDSARPPAYERADEHLEPAALLERAEFHQLVEELPVDERTAIDLVVYQGMTHAEAGAVLGVAEKTVLRRKQRALEMLHQRLTAGGDLP